VRPPWWQGLAVRREREGDEAVLLVVGASAVGGASPLFSLSLFTLCWLAGMQHLDGYPLYPGQPYLAAPQPAYSHHPPPPPPHHHQPFSPLPTDSPSPSLHRHDFADPLNSASYFDQPYPSYGQPHQPQDAAAVDHERQAASIKLEHADHSAYRHSPGKASQLFGTFKSRNQVRTRSPSSSLPRRRRPLTSRPLGDLARSSSSSA